MSVNPIGLVPQHYHQTSKPQTAAPTPAQFSQHLDAQTSEAVATHHHRHHAGESQSVASSAKAAASAVAPVGIASSILNLLS